MSDEKNKKGFLESISSFSLILIMVILTVIGIALTPMVNVSQKPATQKKSYINIWFRWTGASPQVIEQEVTSKIEGAISVANGIERIWSNSNVGSGSVSVEVKKNVNISVVRFEISSIIRQLYKSLPEGVSYPYVSGGTVDSGTKTVQDLLSYRINADMEEDMIQDYAIENIKPIIEQIDGVYEVNVSGGMPEEMEIIYNPVQLAKYKLKARDITLAVANLLDRSNIIGDIDYVNDLGEDSRITIHLRSPKINQDITNLPIKKVEDKIITLGSIATIHYKDKDPTRYFRIDGQNTVYLHVEVTDEYSIIPMSERVRAKMDEIQEDLIDGYNVILTKDAAEEVKAEISKLVRRTLLSLFILMFFVWLVSKSLRYLIIIAITLVANVFISIILYYLTNVQLHVFSLAGIAVSFGILIDTSIVMVDHYSYYKNRQVFIAILAALLTTISSLVIIILMPEQIKLYLYDFSVVIIINLSISLLVSLFFVPAVIDRFGYSSKENTKKIDTRRRIVSFSEFYRKYLTFTQQKRWIFIVAVILFFGLPIHLLPPYVGYKRPWQKNTAKLEWYHKLYNGSFGSDLYQQKLKRPLEFMLGGTLRAFSQDIGSFSRTDEEEEMVLVVKGRMPQGGTIMDMNDKFVELENYLATQTGKIDMYETLIKPEEGRLKIFINEEYHDTDYPALLEEAMINLTIDIGGANWNTSGISDTGYSSTPSFAQRKHRISISGYNYNQLYRIAEDVVEIMEKNDSVRDIEIQNGNVRRSSTSVVDEMYINYDREKVALYNFNLAEGYEELSAMLQTSGKRLYSDGKYYNITIRSSECESFNTWHLMNSYITVDDKDIRYSFLGDIGQRQAQKSINKRNQEYSINVAFNFDGDNRQADAFNGLVTEEINSRLPVGFTTENSSYGWSKDDGEQYWLLILIVVIIFFVCSILFESLQQPLVIVSLIPLSFIGTFLTFIITKIEFGIGGLASLVMLSGLVVNAAIYIINEFNNSCRAYRDYNISAVDLYAKSYNHKIIPVLLTIISTVLGLVPFLLDGVKEKFWFSFAVGTMGGLLFSIFALIFILPALLKIRNRYR